MSLKHDKYLCIYTVNLPSVQILIWDHVMFSKYNNLKVIYVF